MLRENIYREGGMVATVIILMSKQEQNKILLTDILYIMARTGIHQLNYAFWLGHFAKMASAEVFVFLDDAQMPVGPSYISRAQIKGRECAQWLTVPMRYIFGESINSVCFADKKWPRKHIATL
jgi:hypothetical protein